MAATIHLKSRHDATGSTATDVESGSLRFKVADNDTVDLNDAVSVPTSGTNRSYIKQLQLYADSTPANQITNILFYTDGTNSMGTGVGLVVKTSVSYTNPLTQGTTALTSTSDVFTFTIGAPLSVTGSLTNPTTGYFGHLLQLQATVASTASPGTTTDEVLTVSYDEQ